MQWDEQSGFEIATTLQQEVKTQIRKDLKDMENYVNFVRDIQKYLIEALSASEDELFR